MIGRLKDLYGTITQAAEQSLAMLETTPEDAEIEIGYPVDDHEARALGLPTLGAWRAMAAIIIAEFDRPVALVPRGSTPATAAAIDAHGA